MSHAFRQALAPQRQARRRAPTPADLIVILLVIVAVPLSRAPGRADPSGALRLHVQAADERLVHPAQDQRIAVAGPLGTTVVRLENGIAWIESAPCRKRVCQRMGSIRGPGRSLVCIPNRVSVRFMGAVAGVDAITR